MIFLKQSIGFVLGIAIASSFFIPVVTAAPPVLGSGNWAGYVSREGEHEGVGAKWIVPKANTETPIRGHATWVGVGGFGSTDLIQSGTLALVDGNGIAHYRAWYELLPEAAVIIPLEVRAGDRISVSINKKTGDTWHIAFVNLTTKKSFTKLVEYESAGTTADWVHEMASLGDSIKLPLDDFPPVTFTDAWTTVDGARLSITESKGSRVYMNDDARTPLVRVNKATKNGSEFTISRTSKKVTLGSVNKNNQKISVQNARIKDISLKKLSATETPFSLTVKWE